MNHEQVTKVRPVLSNVIGMANPVFVAIAVLLPVGALVFALGGGSTLALNYVHIMTGAMWTGIDLFMGFVLGPVLGSMDPGGRAGVFRRLVPKMTFLMPVPAAVTITSGIELTQWLGYGSPSNLFAPLTNPWILASVVIVAILTVQGFGLLLPNETRVFQQLLSETPNVEKISRLGMRNAKLGGLQGIFSSP